MIFDHLFLYRQLYILIEVVAKNGFHHSITTVSEIYCVIINFPPTAFSLHVEGSLGVKHSCKYLNPKRTYTAQTGYSYSYIHYTCSLNVASVIAKHYRLIHTASWLPLQAIHG